MIVNDITAIILVAPLLMPLVKAIGIDPVHFAAIVCVNLGVGGVTPPYASVLYLGMKVGKVEFTQILKPAMAFVLIVYLPALILTTYLPELSLWLPRLLGYVR
jgi:TRAP-type C4-dicarboxylate transport system permease large subunit